VEIIKDNKWLVAGKMIRENTCWPYSLGLHLWRLTKENFLQVWQFRILEHNFGGKPSTTSGARRKDLIQLSKKLS
jgi:hypothetical protein